MLAIHLNTMSKIKIKNFGPIKEGYQENDGWLDIKKVTVFIGNQGSGKSTVAKLISTFTWIEKALTRGDFEQEYFERKDVFLKYCNYHKIDGYFDFLNNRDTIIEYTGDSYAIRYYQRRLKIDKIVNEKYNLPQIMYIPADRNFTSTIDDLKTQRLFSEPLFEFLSELQKAKREIKEDLELPINNIRLEYDKSQDLIYVKGDGYRIKLSEASSGIQSFVPLYLVSKYLSKSVDYRDEFSKDEPMNLFESEKFQKAYSDIYHNNELTLEQKRIALSVIASKFNKTAFINIVEEPEQNLFPTSQRQMLNSLINFNNMSEGNKLIMTTHSPYIINYITLAIETNKLKDKIKDDSLKNKLNNIVPLNSTINPNDVVIYELEDTGQINILGNYNGLPSDENKLNENLGYTNDLFSQLLDIEELCQ